MSDNNGVEKFWNPKDPMAQPLIREAKSGEEKRKKAMSPPGSLGLPPLLEQRRWEHFITDGAFKLHCFGERVRVWPVSRYVGEKVGGIFLPETTQDRERMTTSRGILVAAGLVALDQLRSNGIDLGHMVEFIRAVPWSTICDDMTTGLSKELRVLGLMSGDITGSEDTETLRREGKVRIATEEVKQPDGSVITVHYFVDEQGKQWTPISPGAPVDE